MLITYNGIEPSVDKSAYVAESAELIGRVTIGPRASVWPMAVLRGDIEPIVVGECSNIQDCCVVHTNYDLPAVVGDYVTVGHGAVLHGCRIGSNCLIGMGAIILDGEVIGDNCLIGAGTVVPEKKVIPPGSLVLGLPGKVVRNLEPGEIKRIRDGAEEYFAFAEEHKKNKFKHP